MKRLFLVAAVLLCSQFSFFNSLQAQRLNTAYTYATGIDSTLWYDIDDIGESLIATGGARSQLTSIGFPFRYDGTEYTQFSVNRFGMVRFGSDMVQSYISNSNRPLGSEADSYAPGVVVIGCNTTLDENSYVRVAPVGTPGSRVMVLEMYMKLYGTTGGRVKVQMQLFEGSNNMRLVYGPLEGNAPTSAYQIGFVPRSSDVALIKVSDNTLLYANTTSQTNASRTWPDAWRWYQISYDNNYCSLFTTPWSENFNTVDNLGCWTMLDYDGYSYTHWDRYYRTSGDYSMWARRNDYACNDWMVTPPIQLPADSDGLMLMYEFRAAGDDGDCGEMEVRVAPYGTGDVPAVDTNDFDAPLWLDGIRSTSDFERRGLSLAAYAGQKVRIAFVHVRLHSNSNIYVDNVSVAQTTVPSVRIDAPHRVHAHEGTLVTAYLNEGSNNGLSYTWHSSLLDTTLVSTASTATITYTAAGSDTLTCIATNIHGADTTQVVIDVVDCSTVRCYPWKDDFEHGLDCWYQLGGWITTSVYGSYEGEMALRSNCDSRYYTSGSRWIISQPFAIPALADTAMMELIWQMRTRSMYSYDYNQFNLRIATVTGDAVPVDSAFTTVMSKEMHYGPWERYRYDLSAYAGQTIRFMFYNWPNNDHIEPVVLIDQVEVRSTREPVVMIEAPYITEDVDSVVYTAILDEGDTAGLTYTWHSTLLDTTIVTTAPIATITYNTVGVDTLTLIASNLWGNDTAVAVVRVRNCPVQTLPFVVNFEDNSALNCWSGFTCQYVSSTDEYVTISNETPWYIAGDSTNHYIASTTDLGWLVSPAIDVPSDTADFYLSWDQLGGRVQVMVATGEDYTHESDFTQFRFINGTGHQRFSMAQYAGRRIHIAFVSNYSYYNHKIDNISLAYFDVTPVVTLSAPDTVRENQSVVVNTTLNDCSHRDLNYTWHSTLLDTTILTQLSTLNLMYPSTGIDTLTLIVSNYYGADTQQAIIVVIGCNGLRAPYSEDFNSLTGVNCNSANGVLPPCWNILWGGSLNNAPKVLTHNQQPFPRYNSNALILMASGNRDNNWDSVVYAILPSFADNLNTLALSLRHVHENVNQGTLTVGYMDTGIFVPLAQMPAVAGIGQVDTVSFLSVPATATNIALRWLKNTQVWYSVLVDDVNVFVANPVGAPTIVHITGPTSVVAFDDVTFTAQLQSGDTTGLTYTWHSTLLDTTIVTIANTATITYNTAGVDTLTLIATSASGSDTVSIIVTVTTPVIPPTPPDIVWRTVSVTANEEGVCETYGSGRYLDSSSVEIGFTMMDTATAGGHWQFLGWSDGETGNPRDILVTSDTTVVALFQWISDSTEEISDLQLLTSDVIIYPNPSSSDVTVRVSQPLVLTLIDLHGREVLRTRCREGKNRIDIGSLPAGVYYVRLAATSASATLKLVIQ